MATILQDLVYTLKVNDQCVIVSLIGNIYGIWNKTVEI